MESEAIAGPNQENQHRVLIYSLFVVAVFGSILWFARDALAPFVFSMVLIYMLLPAVHWTEARLPNRIGEKQRRAVAVIGVMVAGFGAAGLLLAVLAEPLVRQTSEMLNDFSHYLDVIGERYPDANAWYTDTLPEGWRSWIDGHVKGIGAALWSASAAILNWLLSITGSIVSSVVSLITIPLFTIHYLLDERATVPTLRKRFPAAWADEIVAGFRIFDRVFGRYTRGVMVESVLVGIITGAGYWLIGVDLFLPLGVIALVGEIVPIIGPWMAFFISFPVVLATQPDLAIPAVAVFLVIQALEGWFLAPMIQSEANDLTNAGTLIVLAIGGALAGGIGVVLALPAANLIRTMAVYGYHRVSGASPSFALAELGFDPDPDTSAPDTVERNTPVN
ncbi:MAG: AI-2E family transporter [Thermomicrobiales bacterium]